MPGRTPGDGARGAGVRPRRRRPVSPVPAERRVPVNLRDATHNDRETLVALVLRCDETYRDWAGPELRLPARAEELSHWHRRFADPVQRLRVAEVDRAIASGRAWAQARQAHGVGPAIAGRAHVSAMFVDPGHWRQGIAAALMRDA